MDASKISDTVKFQELFTYHRDLVNRRWQYFAAFLLVQGLMLNAWKDISDANTLFLIAMTCAALLTGCVFLRLISRSRRRIKKSNLALNRMAGEEIMEIAKKGTVGWTGITLWLYITIVLFSVPWFILLYKSNLIVFVALSVIYIGNLVTLEIRVR